MYTEWKTSLVTLPAGPYTMGPFITSVRTNGTDFQVHVKEDFGSICFRSAESFLNELQESMQGLENSTVYLRDGDDFDPTTFMLEGWRVPTDEEMEVIQNHKF
jgi:hypothetical protein